MERPPPIYIPQSSSGLDDRDDERLVIIHQSGPCYSGCEESFERIAHLCARTFKVPLAIVSFLDTTKQWLKSKLGFDYGNSSQQDATVSFYSSLISEQTSRLLVIKDFMEDERFQKHPKAWASQNLRFYAGANLVVNGVKIGTLCMIDKVPRLDFDENKETLFLEMADLLVEILEEMQNQQFHTYNHSVHLHQTLLGVLEDPLERLNASFYQMQRISSGLRRDISWGRFSALGNMIDTFANNVHQFENLVESSLKQLHGATTEKAPQWESDHFQEGVSYEDIDGCPFPSSLDLAGNATTPSHHPPDDVSVASWIDLLSATVHSDRELGEDKVAVHPCVSMDMNGNREKYWLQHHSNTSPVSQQLMMGMNQSVSQMLIVAVTIYLRHFLSLPQYQQRQRSSHLRSFLPIETSVLTAPAITVIIDIDTEESALLIEICPVHYYEKTPLSLGLETTIQMLLHGLRGVICDVFEHDSYKVLLTIPLYFHDPSVMVRQVSFDDPCFRDLVTVVNDTNHSKQLHALHVDTSRLSPIEESCRRSDFSLSPVTEERLSEAAEDSNIISCGDQRSHVGNARIVKGSKGSKASTPSHKGETTTSSCRNLLKAPSEGNSVANLHIRAKPLPHSPTLVAASHRSPRSFSCGLPSKRRLNHFPHSQPDVGTVAQHHQQRPWWWQLLVPDDIENEAADENSVEENAWLKSSSSSSMSNSHSFITGKVPSTDLNGDTNNIPSQNQFTTDISESNIDNLTSSSSMKKGDKGKKRLPRSNSRISLSLLFSKSVTITPPPPTPAGACSNSRNLNRSFSGNAPVAPSPSSSSASGHTSSYFSSSGGSSNSSSNSASGSTSCRSIRVPIPVIYPIARTPSFLLSPSAKVKHLTSSSFLSPSLPTVPLSADCSPDSISNQNSVPDKILTPPLESKNLHRTFSNEEILQQSPAHETENTITNEGSDIASISSTASQSIDFNDDLATWHPYTDTDMEELSPLIKRESHQQYYQHRLNREAWFSHNFHHSFHRPLHADKNHHFRKQSCHHGRNKRNHFHHITRKTVTMNHTEYNRNRYHQQYCSHRKRPCNSHHQDSPRDTHHSHGKRTIRITGHTLHHMSPQVAHCKKIEHPCYPGMIMPLLAEAMKTKKKIHRDQINLEEGTHMVIADSNIGGPANVALGV